MKKNLKNLKGITLISLVVTIIVLLILAGISVTTITSNNGILTRAKEAKEQTVIGQEKESVELAYITAAMKKLGDNVTSEELQHELDLSVGANKTQVAGQDILQVLFTETEHSYEVENGTVTRTEIFDANDGFYIAGQKTSMKVYVPKKDAIVSDIMLKGYLSEESYIIGGGLCELSKINSEYLDVLEELNYIDDNMRSFIKTSFLNTATNSSEMRILGVPMFIIKKVDDKYYLTMEWDYLLDEDEDENNNNTVFKSKVRISSEITFTNSDYTQYTLGDLKVEENAYECTTSSAPFANNIPDKNSIITDLSITYNNKNYIGKDGLKDFLDNIVGLKNKEIAQKYVLIAKALNGEITEEEQEYLFEPVSVVNADILTKYLKDSNKLDGLYVKGQRITSKLQYDEFDSISPNDEESFLEQYMSRLLQLWSYGILGDVKYFKVLLDKQIIDPVIINTMVNGRTENLSVKVRNLSISKLWYEEGKFYLPNTGDITSSKAFLGEIFDYDWNLDFSVGVSLNLETSDIEFNNFSLNPELVSACFYHYQPDEFNFEWDYFRQKGLVAYLNENILPFPDKQEFWTFFEANKYKMTENQRNHCDVNQYEKNAEIDAYIYMYRLIIKEAIENGEYEIKNDGKTYTGTRAFENFLREEYGLNRNKLQEYIDDYNENNY